MLDEEIFYFYRCSDPQRLKEKVDTLILPCANWLSQNSNLENLAYLIRDVDLPVLVFGLGAQSCSEKRIPELNEGTIRFLNEASKRTPYIYVRGRFSKNVCSHYGIHNTKILGCPSILLNPSRELGLTLEDRYSNLDFRRIGWFISSLPDYLLKTEKKILDLTDKKVTYLVNSGDLIYKIINEEDLTPRYLKHFDVVYKNLFQHFFKNKRSVIQFIRKNSRYFLNPSEYFHYVKNNFTFISGTRIHGSISGLNCGTPTICITHDSRTRELCDVHKIPSLEVGDFQSITSLNDLKKHICFDGGKFGRERIRKANEYLKILDESNLTPSNKLKYLSKETDILDDYKNSRYSRIDSHIYNSPRDFDWKQYVVNYPDLQKAGINTKEKAITHWFFHGRYERRKYKP